jgi:hypothetical protein
VKILEHLESLKYLISFGVSGKYSNDSFNYCGDAYNRRSVCTDVLNAHLMAQQFLAKRCRGMIEMRLRE